MTRIVWLAFLMAIPCGARAQVPAATQQAYDEFRARATEAAGEPGDIPQRVVALHAIFEDSGRNHDFPQVALHGALWAYGYFEVTGTLGDLISYRYFYDPAEMAEKKALLAQFATDFKATNRQVFIDTYTNYYFTRDHGHDAGAGELLNPDLLAALNEVHEARRNGVVLPLAERRRIFVTALRWEQEESVGPRVASAVARFGCPVLEALALKPVVHFKYFPAWKSFFFSDFSNKAERIRYATEAFDLAESAGWDRVVGTMGDYSVPLPE